MTNKVQTADILADLDSLIDEESELRSKGLRHARGAERMMGLVTMPVHGDAKGTETWLVQARKNHELNKERAAEVQSKVINRKSESTYRRSRSENLAYGKRNLKDSTALETTIESDGESGMYRRIIRV